MYKSFVFISSVCLFLFVESIAAPVFNEIHQLLQPDGSFVPVSISGDEFYQVVEDPSGYTLIRDAQTGWICYAALSNDGTQYLSTGIRYNPANQSLVTMLSKHIRVSSASVLAIRKARFYDLNKITYEASVKELLNREPILTRTMKTDTVYGLTVLIDFPDQKSAVAKEEIEKYLNTAGYTGFQNNGSIRDYFYDVSAGNQLYLQRLAGFITAKNNKSYYDRSGGYAGATELINEILTTIKNGGTFDFSTVTQSNGSVRAVNLLYAGSPSQGWAQGLWPHSGSVNFTISTGLKISRYQMTNIGTSLSLGTFVHENGHMLCGWADLYAYDNHSSGAGGYCVMSGSGGRNPVQPNAFFRSLKGWIEVRNITQDPLGNLYKHVANSASAYTYTGEFSGSAKESYWIEARRKTGRSATIPDEGLLIWHVDKDGSNTSSGKNDYCVPEQADGKNDLENSANSGGAGDLFHSGDKTKFNDNTTPSAKWHNASSSKIQVANVSIVGDEMSFSLGDVVGIQKNNTNPDHGFYLHATQSGIRYRVPVIGNEAHARITIGLYDLNGALIKTLLNETVGAGITHTIRICPSTDHAVHLPAGIYLCKMRTSGVTKAAKFVLQ